MKGGEVSEPIKKITLKNGAVRYRFVIDIGRDPETGKRQQKTCTFDTKREARAEYSKIRNQMNEGTYIRPSTMTVAEYLDGWMEGATRNLRESSRRSYRDALRPAYERLGAMPIQKVTKADVERMVTWMQTSGRRRGGKPGTGLGPRSIRLTLGRLSAAFQTATMEGIIPRNVVKLVKPPTYTPDRPDTWSKAEVRRFLSKAKADRLHAPWRLSLYGLRRGEVLGLRWAEDVDFGSFAKPCKTHRERWCVDCYGKGKGYRLATIQVQQARVLVEGKEHLVPPKSRNGFRELPLDVAIAAALRALRVKHAAEKLAAGEAYTDSGYVVVDELGVPVGPEWYSDEFGRLAKRAGVKRIVLHEGRHTALSLMEKAGVPISVVSRWAGHYDSAFTYSTYVHASGEDLRAGTNALGKLYKIN
jgi:integrase